MGKAERATWNRRRRTFFFALLCRDLEPDEDGETGGDFGVSSFSIGCAHKIFIHGQVSQASQRGYSTVHHGCDRKLLRTWDVGLLNSMSSSPVAGNRNSMRT